MSSVGSKEASECLLPGVRGQYFHFVKAASKFGRDDIIIIAADMQLPIEQVKAYSEAFWTYGPTELKQDEWERVVVNVEKGETVCSDL